MRPATRNLLAAAMAAAAYVAYAAYATVTHGPALHGPLQGAVLLILLSWLVLAFVARVRHRDRAEVHILAREVRALRNELREAVERTVPMVVSDMSGTHVLARELDRVRTDLYDIKQGMPNAMDASFRKGMIAGVAGPPPPEIQPRLSIVPRGHASGRS